MTYDLLRYFCCDLKAHFSHNTFVHRGLNICLQSGVSQIRHAQPFADHAETGSKTPQPQETIVPSYSIDVDSPTKLQKAAEEQYPSTSLPPAVPNSKFFKISHDCYNTLSCIRTRGTLPAERQVKQIGTNGLNEHYS